MIAKHQYAVGDNVRYLSSPKAAYRAPGIYRIVRLRPTEGPDLQYWVRSEHEDFDRIASQFELEIIRSHPNTRTTRKFVTIPAPFKLKAMEHQGPAGVYEIITTEETLGNLMFEAYRRISTTIYIPPRSGDYGMGSFIETDIAELEKAMNAGAS
jgi:hypothetical protein